MSVVSTKSLIEKLGIKSNYRIAVVNPPRGYASLLGILPAGVVRAGANLDFVHIFARDQKELVDKLVVYKKMIKPNGSIWVSWPKGTSRVPTDLNENVIRGIAILNNLVDVKVAAVDSTWSGLKLVVPQAKRKAVPEPGDWV